MTGRSDDGVEWTIITTAFPIRLGNAEATGAAGSSEESGRTYPELRAQFDTRIAAGARTRACRL